ncbi:group II intron maturase-specific domain-containing protein [Planctomycetota bacterium]
MIRQLARYLSGWRAYFGFCETPSVLRDLDSWIPPRLPLLHLEAVEDGAEAV